MNKYSCFALLIVYFTLVACEEVEKEKVVEVVSEGELRETKKYENDDDFEKEKGVYVLNGNSFAKFLESKEIILVEFYAPWCGHCKALMPEFEGAAKELEDKKHVALAKVDATVETQLAERFEVSGYPTLIAFKNEQQLEFDGARTKEGIVAFLNQLSSPTWTPPKEHVLVLSKDNFTNFINDHDVSVVMFYAPWCGHCKKLKPEYEKAAKELQLKDINVPLTKVDATVDKELASKYKVEGYPTMKVFRKGREYAFKSDARDKWGLVSYIESLIQPASSPLSSLQELKKLIANSQKLVLPVAFFESADHPLFNVYLEAANSLMDDMTFRHINDPKVTASLNLPPNCFVLFATERFHTKHEPHHRVLEIAERTKSEDIITFIHKHQLPLMGEYVLKDTEQAYKDARPLVLFFYTVDWTFEHRDAAQLWRHKFADIATKHPSMTFAIADEETNQELFNKFGFEDSAEEINVGILAKGDLKYPMEPMEEYEAEVIEDFIKDFNKGKLKPLVKSQARPLKQKGHVVTVVGKTFEEVVMDDKKDVLIELYAPWCGHCKQLEPLYKKLAKKLKHEKLLVVAKMDATANDSPYDAEGFPTIYFAPANNKASPIKFTGERSVDELEKFVRENAVVAFKAGKEEL